MNRRELLHAGVVASIGGLFLPRALRAQAKTPVASFWAPAFVGDDPTVGHKFRDGELALKPVLPSEQHEVVIVGGGLSGLTAAFRLRQTDVVVLESAVGPGGNAKATTWNKESFNIGAAYFVEVEGEQGELLAEANVDYREVPLPQDAWRWRDQWLFDPWHDESVDARLPSGFARALAGLRQEFKKLGDDPNFPQNDYRTSTAQALTLDSKSFRTWLTPYADPEIMPFLESYCYSAMGASSSTVSAYAALNFAVEFVGRVYAAPEGNYTIARSLAAGVDKAGAGRIKCGCFVHKLSAGTDGRVRISYVQDGESRAMEARQVILATPYFLSGRLIEGLAADQRAALCTHDYAPYIVANLCFEGLEPGGAYDQWVPGLAPFDDFIPVSWTKKPEEKQAERLQVISCFAPARHQELARWQMLHDPAETFAAPIVQAFERLNPGATKKLRKVLISRWGHGIIVNRPGMICRWLRVIKGQYGPITLAHSDGLGLPAVESATHEGIVAAQKVLAALGS
jgi:glycine/D-amino acid oxidase-like deaminating enzyme